MDQEEVDLRKAIGATDLDPKEELDRVLLEELRLMNKWAGLNCRLVYCTKEGTAAYQGGLIGVNKAQLKTLWGSLSTDAFRTAVFLALAHEAGHQTQFKRFGYDEVLRRKRREVEAHADVLAGVWMGLRLAGGRVFLPDDVRDAAMKLTGSSGDYPSANQRAELFLKGMSMAALIVTTEDRNRIATSETLTYSMSEGDVNQLLTIAKTLLQRTPD